MKYSKEQIKDLLILKQKGCVGRVCLDCQWDTKRTNCWLRNQPEWRKTKWEGYIDTPSKRIKEVATIILRGLIFKE